MPHKDKETRKFYNRAYNQANREQIRVYNRDYKRAHHEEENARSAAWRKANPEAVSAYNRDYRQMNVEEVRAKDRVYKQANQEKVSAYDRAYKQTHKEPMKTRHDKYIQALKTDALRLLGNKCACPGCGIGEPLFLTIDHIHGRPKGSRPSRPLAEAKASGWDKTKFQILCWNCNMTKSNRGFCPVHHKDADSGPTNGHNPDVNDQASLWPL